MTYDTGTLQGKILDSIEACGLFMGFEEEDLLKVLPLCKPHWYSAEEVIIREDDLERSLYIIINGSVEILKRIPEEQLQKVAVLRSECFEDSQHMRRLEAAFFGEMAILDFQPRSATVRTLEVSEIVELDGDELLRFLSHEKELYIFFLTNVARTLSRRLRGMLTF